MSMQHADLISGVDAYLGLETFMFSPDGLSPGVVLCMLCILWWCLYLCREFRAIVASLEGLWQVPLQVATDFEDGSLRSLSRVRFWLFYAARLSKAVISGLLLAAGIQWLTNTTSIKDLLLHAVALKSLLELDTILYAAFMPKKIQVKIKKLKPLQFRSSAWRSQIESLFFVLCFLALMLWTWFQLIDPLMDTMQVVKREYCGGNQDFVVAINEHHGIAVARPTAPYVAESMSGHLEIAVYEYAFASQNSQHILFHGTTSDFENTRLETIETAATALIECVDLDSWFLRGEGVPVASLYGPYWWSTAVGLGLATNSTCADMAAHCDSSESQLLRMVCGVTCGCGEPQANVMYKVQAQGCLKKCSQAWKVTVFIGEPTPLIFVVIARNHVFGQSLPAAKVGTRCRTGSTQAHERV